MPTLTQVVGELHLCDYGPAFLNTWALATGLLAASRPVRCHRTTGVTPHHLCHVLFTVFYWSEASPTHRREKYKGHALQKVGVMGSP